MHGRKEAGLPIHILSCGFNSTELKCDKNSKTRELSLIRADSLAVVDPVTW